MPQKNLGKPKLLVFPFGYLSHYLRCLVLARQLSEDFTVCFAGDEAYNAYILKEGFDVFDCKGMDAAHALDCVRKFNFSWLSEEALEASLNEQVRAIRELEPVAVLGDASPTLKMAAAATGVPFISLINGYMSKYFAGTRALSVTHPAYPLVSKLPPKLAGVLTAQGEAFGFRAVHRPFKRIRRRWGLSQCSAYPDELEGDYNLVADLLSLFPQKKLPASYRVIAPLYYMPAEAYPKAVTQSGQKRRIYVSMGSTGAWNAMQFLNEPQYAVYDVIAAGDAKGALHAPHITHSAFANAAEIFPDTDLVICHGGNGSVYQALAYGIPVLCHASHFEQEWNVAAIVREGLGQSLSAVPDDAKGELVSHWVAQKGTGPLSVYRQKIASYEAAQPQAVRALSTELLAGMDAGKPQPGKGPILSNLIYAIGD